MPKYLLLVICVSSAAGVALADPGKTDDLTPRVLPLGQVEQSADVAEAPTIDLALQGQTPVEALKPRLLPIAKN